MPCPRHSPGSDQIHAGVIEHVVKTIANALPGCISGSDDQQFATWPQLAGTRFQEMYQILLGLLPEGCDNAARDAEPRPGRLRPTIADEVRHCHGGEPV